MPGVDELGLSAVRRIVVLRPNHRLGNALLLTPLVQELEANFPKAEIEYVTTGPAAHAVFERFTRVTALHTFPSRSYRHPARVLAILMALKHRSYDLAIDPSVRSRAGRFLLGHTRARARLGFAWGVPGRDRMLTHAVDPALAPAHCAQAPVYLLRSGLRPCPTSDGGDGSITSLLDLRLTKSERCEGQRRLATALGPGGQSRPTLGIFAHASGDKCFPADWWSRVITELRSQVPMLRLLEFTPADGHARLGGDITALHTPDLRLLGATLAATSLLATADCGVMHLADAAGARVLGLFRTTDPSRYGPGSPCSGCLVAKTENTDIVVARIREAL